MSSLSGLELAPDRSKAKIYPEQYHLEAMEERLDHEEAVFSERVASRKVKRTPKAETPLLPFTSK